MALLCLIGFFKPNSAFSEEITPFDSFNQNPFISIFGLPGPGNFLLLPSGHTETGMDIILSSNYAVDENAREKIVIDGETTRFTFTARHSVSPRMEVGMKVPYIINGGGFLDSFIEGYHSTFGFPQGGRDQAPRNRLLYRYSRDGSEKVRLDSSGSGIGDIRLTAALQLIEHRDNNEGIAINIGVKLPTGESNQLRGSGSTDISLSITGGTGGRLTSGKWTTYGSTGMLFMTEGKVLPEQQKRWVGFGSLGVGWVPLTRLSLKVQADAHTPFFSGSDLKEIAASSVQLIVGGTLAVTEKTKLEIGVAEDLIVNTAPDVSFYLTLRTQF